MEANFSAQEAPVASGILVNQVGYELAGPKRFLCRFDENLGPSGRFEITDGTGRMLFEGVASRIGLPDSPPYIYQGDFSAFRESGGDFRVAFEAGNRVAISRSFGVGRTLLRRLAVPLLLDFLRSRRFARANYSGSLPWTQPGVLPDDGLFHDVCGGWLERPGELATDLFTGSRVMSALLVALQYADKPVGRVSDLWRGKSVGRSDPAEAYVGQMRAELRWGVDWLRRLMIDYPRAGRIVAEIRPDGELGLLGPGAGRCPHMALLTGFILAKASEVFADNDLLRRAIVFRETYHVDLGGLSGLDAEASMMLTELALHVATLEPGYLASAEMRLDALLDRVDGWEKSGLSLPAAALTDFVGSLPSHPATPKAKEALSQFLEGRVRSIQKDDTEQRAGEAWQALSAHRVSGRHGFVERAMDSLNWIFGMNLEDVCLMRGLTPGGGSWERRRSDAKTAGGSVASNPAMSDSAGDTSAAASLLMAIALV